MATLAYTLAGDVLALLETEVPEALRGTGMAGMLAKTALDYAREHHLKVDVICPFVADISELIRNIRIWSCASRSRECSLTDKRAPSAYNSSHSS